MRTYLPVKEWLEEKIKSASREELENLTRRLASQIDYDDLNLMFGAEMTKVPDDETMTLEEFLSFVPLMKEKSERTWTSGTSEYRVHLSSETGNQKVYYYGIYDFKIPNSSHRRYNSWGWKYELVFENDRLKSVKYYGTDWGGDPVEYYDPVNEFIERFRENFLSKTE